MNKWFNEVRYGMFIHWGAYSQAARGEWIMNRELIPADEYRRLYVENFRAENYDPAVWAQQARDWGFGYAVLTTRHHDGYALWDSKVNPFNAAKLGPKRDLVAPYVAALRAAGLKVGLYYSPANWSHPDYPGPFFRDWPGENDWKDGASRQRFIAYYRAELEELLTGYGKIDYLWFDGCIPENIDGAETIEMLRKWQPEMLINNRLGNPFDIKCCEQAIKAAQPGQDWEACMTLNDNWGYNAHDENWKSPVDVIKLLCECAGQGGNLLLNVGPMADGTIPAGSVKILDAVGKWMQVNREAFSASERFPFPWTLNAGRGTVKGNKVYLPFFRDPGATFCWGELRNQIKSIDWLDNREPIAFRKEGNRLFMEGLTFNAPARIAVIETEGKPEANTAQTTFWIPG